MINSANPGGAKLPYYTRTDETGIVWRFLPQFSIRIHGNGLPANFDKAKLNLLPEFGFNLNEHKNWLWFDPNLNIWRCKPPRPRFGLSFPIYEYPLQILHLVCYANKILKTKAYFKRAARDAVGGGDHDIIGTADLRYPKFQIARGPNFNCHNFSLSERCLPSPPSETDAGGVSIPARKGGGAKS